MKIALKSIADKGNLQKERLVIRVTENTDTGDYVLMRTGYVNGEVTSGSHGAYWFPYKEVREGDLVVVYSKKGENSQKPLDSGKTAHFFYWGSDSTLWDKTDKAAVILHAPDWESAGAAEL